MRLIDADALYEQTAEWEARALSVIEKKNHKPFDEMDVNEIVEWRKWSCILDERSAFKHDVFDAPSIDAVQRTDDVLQRMQDIEQAQIEKAYDIGYAEGKADAVPVVRCKDCKYYKENTLACSRYGLEDDDYCSWAERKES